MPLIRPVVRRRGLGATGRSRWCSCTTGRWEATRPGNLLRLSSGVWSNGSGRIVARWRPGRRWAYWSWRELMRSCALVRLDKSPLIVSDSTPNFTVIGRVIRMKFILSIAVALVLTACAVFQADEITGSWKGKHIDDLILSWGPPRAIYEAGDGRITATFSHSRVISATQYYCNVTFGTDASGTITTATVDGNLGGCNRFFADKGPPQ